MHLLAGRQLVFAPSSSYNSLLTSTSFPTSTHSFSTATPSFPAIAKTLPKTYQARGEKAAKELAALFAVSSDGHVVLGKNETSIRADELLGFLVTKRKSSALNEIQLHRIATELSSLQHVYNPMAKETILAAAGATKPKSVKEGQAEETTTAIKPKSQLPELLAKTKTKQSNKTVAEKPTKSPKSLKKSKGEEAIQATPSAKPESPKAEIEEKTVVAKSGGRKGAGTVEENLTEQTDIKNAKVSKVKTAKTKAKQLSKTTGDSKEPGSKAQEAELEKEALLITTRIKEQIEQSKMADKKLTKARETDITNEIGKKGKIAGMKEATNAEKKKN